MTKVLQETKEWEILLHKQRNKINQAKDLAAKTKKQEEDY
jgi:hypothetical protein